ncbi:hypothetical protein MJO29_005879 [Puccinia striiformis f. sp. tritici]|uniref:Methyltransferase domain-containing protein n=1 Tax=Puccinia striiformis f. sp. tritici PST-78 TaxID=1165861 RepID=A0A0L0V4X2_9BASI|nr:hypothetical protein Pst134EA_011075 [Puccinia striiformis f. sp. tritici]KAH9467428.1 hypothetical protein Pst134EA_011075 [Puccinia striiformis f. sp. tritici]KAI7957662.1 hypothetical protein MJO29_005879 [Puccinia striiformis f. sp. tritici]KNE94360.1 hypothetical protein PSTG_12262 [Puccinia striiformis f. sp. tritici PST-78]
MSSSKQTQDKPKVDMDQFGAAMGQMPASEKGIEAPYPLDDPKMSEQLTFFKAATGIHDPEKLKAHIHEIRTEGCKTFPFPCILCFYFLQGMIVRHPFYHNVRKEIEKKSSNRKIFLDIGAGMCTDLRQTIYYGWNRNDVIGVDVASEWKPLGYKLFGDSDRPIPYFLGNILEPKVLDVTDITKVDTMSLDLHSLKNLNPLKGKAKFITLNQLFHFFDEAGQRKLAERCALLLSDEAGSSIFGMQIGGVKKGLESHKMFVHSVETWKELWESILAPRKIKVVSELVDVGPEAHLIPLFEGCKSMQRLYWSVTLL